MLCARVVRGISSTENDVTPGRRDLADRLDRSQRPQEADQHLLAAQQGKVVLAGLVVRAVTEHLDDDVGGAKTSARSATIFAPARRIIGVGIAGLGAGARFHDDLEAGLHEVRNHRGNQRHAPLAREALSRDSDDHEASSKKLILLARRSEPNIVSPNPRKSTLGSPPPYTESGERKGSRIAVLLSQAGTSRIQ